MGPRHARLRNSDPLRFGWVSITSCTCMRGPLACTSEQVNACIAGGDDKLWGRMPAASRAPVRTPTMRLHAPAPLTEDQIPSRADGARILSRVRKPGASDPLFAKNLLVWELSKGNIAPIETVSMAKQVGVVSLT